MPNLLRLLFFFFTLPALAQPIVYVTQKGAGNASGTSWTNALSGTLLAGRVATASPGTQFWVAAGTYKPTTTTDRTASFSIASGVSVYGGFLGTEHTLKERLAGNAETILSGDIGIEGYIKDNTQRIIRIGDAQQEVLISDIVIRNGYIGVGETDYTQPGGISGIMGSGISINVTLSNLILKVANCKFISNINDSGIGDGGAIGLRAYYNGHCKLSITSCTFVENSSANGGAIYRFVSEVNPNNVFIVDNCVFNSNRCFARAGAFFNGAVGGRGDNVLIQKCKFYNNSSLYTAGAIYSGNTCIVSDCVFENNSASESGGAIDGSGSFSTFINCIFAKNKSARGGAVYSTSANSLTDQAFINCTFSENSALFSGSAFFNTLSQLYYNVPFKNKLVLKNCILWKNFSPDSLVFKQDLYASNYNDGQSLPDSSIRANYPTVTNSVIQSINKQLFTGSNNIDTDPLFVNTVDGNFQLQPNSPAINTGDPSTVGLPTFDLAGQIRIQNGRVDMGAYEFGCVPTACQPVLVQRIR
ncbi:choice-of-anchor Q domain-containing protein [Fibrella forsythiae]|uniref:Right-handed parallel beta-helix repeat-containing protein n=1 Tax=Fibrella forsythiae TaxID=2817061 RepID=A0ABS3JMT4_9BACT|nr:choice-of-anchor Q domain-containing protein [Fibrella forsythiae]MBO0951326.1 hypothetical protein [Fibrella forsythiae]